MNYFYLISGTLILLITIYDFFYTTLSGSGAFYISKSVSGYAHRVLLKLSKVFGRRMFALSGMAVNLSVLTVWILLVWLGLMLVYSSNPEAITNSSGVPANTAERLYFTGYILSTLGMGNFVPVSAFFEVLTGIFSFFGFVFFTTAMTYLMQVSSAVVHKRTLALTINNLGNDPASIVSSLLRTDKVLALQQINSIVQMIDRHSINHQAYPVLHYYSNPKEDSSLSINITRFYEAVNILNNNKQNSFSKNLESLNNSLSDFLKHVKEKYGISAENDYKVEIDWQKMNLPEGFTSISSTSPEVYQNRKVLDNMLKNEGFSWQDVYPSS